MVGLCSPDLISGNSIPGKIQAVFVDNTNVFADCNGLC